MVTLSFGHRSSRPDDLPPHFHPGPSWGPEPGRADVPMPVSAVRNRMPRKMPRYVAVPRGVSLLTGQGAFRKVAKSQAQTGRDRAPSPRYTELRHQITQFKILSVMRTDRVRRVGQ